MVIVDSTRKGKLMPDALLKTIPMWCAVLNYILYEDDETDPVWDDLKSHNWLRTSSEIISVNEHHEMVKRLPGFAKEVKRLGFFQQGTSNS
jgi:tRNA A64-2'-O-ribosylphosphate transferase